mgnify:FL=1
MFNKALVALGAVYRQKIEPLQLEGYWSLLQDLSLERFLFGLEEAGKVCKFMPVPSEIRGDGKDYSAPARICLPEDAIVPVPPVVKAKLDRLFGKTTPK